jgi:hypothetical protein
MLKHLTGSSGLVLICVKADDDVLIDINGHFAPA